jgi:hypothetical protein
LELNNTPTVAVSCLLLGVVLTCVATVFHHYIGLYWPQKPEEDDRKNKRVKVGIFFPHVTWPFSEIVYRRHLAAKARTTCYSGGGKEETDGRWGFIYLPSFHGTSDNDSWP